MGHVCIAHKYLIVAYHTCTVVHQCSTLYNALLSISYVDYVQNVNSSKARELQYSLCSLVHFEISVDVFDKHKRSKERHCPNHEEEDIAGEESVAKEFHGL